MSRYFQQDLTNKIELLIQLVMISDESNASENQFMDCSRMLNNQIIIQNPVCRKNFQCLPSIYGSKKKQKKNTYSQVSTKYDKIKYPPISKSAHKQPQDPMKGVSRYLFPGRRKSGDISYSADHRISYQQSQINTDNKNDSSTIMSTVRRKATLKPIEMGNIKSNGLENTKANTHRTQLNKSITDKKQEYYTGRSKAKTSLSLRGDQLSSTYHKLKFKPLSQTGLQNEDIKKSNDIIEKKCHLNLYGIGQIKEENQEEFSQLRSREKTNLLATQKTVQNPKTTQSKLNINLQAKRLRTDANRDFTMFHNLQRKFSHKSHTYSSRSTAGPFQMPNEKQLKQYIQNYKPLNLQFNLKQISKKSTFQIFIKKSSLYLGQTNEKHQKHGYGVSISQKGIFQGKYQNNVKVKGYEKNSEGIYIGCYNKDGLRQGQGEFRWANGQIFQGSWFNGLKNGFGIWRSPEGYSYEGQWFENRQQGEGIFIHSTSTYRGQYKNFLKHGFGQQFFTNGDIYTGYYQNGKPEGKGKYQWKNGKIYEGDFKNGKRQGYGVQIDKNGNTYEGEFTEDQRKQIKKEETTLQSSTHPSYKIRQSGSQRFSQEIKLFQNNK